MINQKEYTLKLRRIDLCDLLIACLITDGNSDAEKWKRLHDEIQRQIEEQDEANK